MRAWSLDDHPILVNFRARMSEVPHNDGKFYHLFLPPPYALTQENASKPFDYLFFSLPKKPEELHLFIKPKVTLKKTDQAVTLGSGFKHKKTNIRIFMETPCTSADGFCFTMYEMYTDLYSPKDATPFCKRILEVYQDAKMSYEFLDKEIKNYKELKDILQGMTDYIFTTEVNENNYQDFLSRMQVTINKACEAVFKLPMCRDLPVFVRTKLNYLIFNAIATKCHFKLLMAYHSVYKDKNLIAQQNMRKVELVHNPDIEASIHIIKNILHLTTPGDCIQTLVKFFDAVVKSLNSNEVAADDILPAICQAMTCDPGFGSHCVSFLTYLADIWPATGLDDRTSYVLITCSVAVTHLSMPRADEPKNEPPKVSQEGQQVTDNTIDMLNEMLDFL